MRNVAASGLFLLGLLCAACAPEPLGTQGKALTATLSRLNLGNPAADAALHVRHGDMRPVGIYGYVCAYPGTTSKALDDLRLKNGLRCLEGTSDAPESVRHRKLIQAASAYALAYNTALVRLTHPGWPAP